MTAHPQPGASSLGRLLATARRRGFVGREAEIEQIRALLPSLREQDDEGAVGASSSTIRIALVHGAGGIGKTALLDRVAEICDEFGSTVVRGDVVDLVDRRSPSFVVDVHRSASPVVLLDGLDERPGAGAWLRDEFLPTLPSDSFVVVAGRGRPESEWTADPGWRQLVWVLRLGALAGDEAEQLLENLGVAPPLRPAVLTFAAGNPLALTLASEEASDAAWSPSRRLVLDLLHRTTIATHDPAQRRALAVAAHVRDTTVDVLRQGLPDDDAVAAFAWLGALPFVEPDSHGLRMDPLVRRLVDAEHRWSDPRGYAALHRALWLHLGTRALDEHGTGLRSAVGNLAYLQRYRHPGRHENGELASSGEVISYADTADAARLEQVRGLGHGHLSDPTWFDFWLERQPEAFAVSWAPETSARAGQATSVLAVLRLGRPVEEELEDPVVAFAWRHAEQAGALAAGQEIGIARFVLPRPDTPHLALSDPRLRLWYEAVLARPGQLAATYVALARPDETAGFMAVLDHHLQARLDVEAGVEWGVFVHDWRRVPLEQHLQRSVPAVGSPADEPDRAPVWARHDFDAAVQQALRDWHDEEAFAANPLVSRLFGDAADPSTTLRAELEKAVSWLGDEPRRGKQHRAVVAAYVRAPVTQEAAAARLEVPLSSFRRHLGKGLALVSNRMWLLTQGQ